MDMKGQTEMARRWVEAGDRAFKQGKHSLAVSIFINAYAIEATEGAKYIIPRVSACYRKLGKARSAIDFYKKAVQEHGNCILDTVVLTAVSSAYGDINDWDNALDCAKRAAALNGGVIDEYLENVFGRINYNLNNIN